MGGRDAGAIGLSLAGGALVALLGWGAARQLTATSLQELVFQNRKPAAGWTVALIFRAKECPDRMALVDQLNRLSGDQIRVEGLLVVDQREFARWADLVIANQIAFPVRAVSPGTARRALGSTPTPALAVYDPNGRLRMLTDLADSRLTSDILAQVFTLSTRSPRGT